MEKRSKILYVDDEVSNLRTFRNTFRREYDIILEESGELGLKRLKQERFDLIISDHRMPEMTGIDFLSKVEEVCSPPPKILLTALNDFNVIRDAVNKAGIFQFVQKPWDAKELNIIIQKALEVHFLKEKNKLLNSEVNIKAKRLEQEMAAKTKLLEEIRKSQVMLLASEERFRSTFEQAAVGIAHINLDGYFTKVNQKLCEITCLSQAELLEENLSGITSHNGLKPEMEIIDQLILAKKEYFSFEKRLIPKDCTDTWVNITVSSKLDKQGNPEYFIAVIEDITNKKRVELNLYRSNRALRVKSRYNEVARKAETESELLDNACQVLVDTGGYKLTWIGYKIEGRRKPVKPVAHKGFEDGYLDKLEVTWGKGGKGKGPAGMPFKTGEPHVIQNIMEVAEFKPWREQASKRGYASVIGLPLSSENEVFGVIVVYANEHDAFDASEKDLLKQFANNLSFNILLLRQKKEKKRTDEVMHRQEFLLDKIINYSSSLIYVKDLYGHFLMANKQFIAFYNLESQKILGRTTEEIFTEKVAFKLNIKDDETIASRKYIEYEETIPLGAREHHYITAKFPLINQENKVYAICAISTDITSLKKKEQEIQRFNVELEDRVAQRTKQLESANKALIDSEVKYRELTELLPQVIFEVDPKLNLVYTNQYGIDSFGYSPEEIDKGLNILDIFPKEEHQRLMQNVKNHFDGKGNLSNEYEVLRKDGTRVPSLIYSSPIIKNGKPRGLRGVLIDITERKKYEEELQKFSEAIEQSPATVVITDTDGLIEYVNPKFEEISGYNKDEVLKQNPRILNAGMVDRSYYKKMWETISSGSIWHGEFCNRKKNGDIYWEVVSISPVKDPSGHIAHYVAVKEDITDRKQIEDELKKAKEAAESANRAKSEFLANMSHEIRTPMNAIIGFTELLSQSIRSNPEANYLKSLRTSSKSLLSLIDDILDLSKVEAGKMDLQFNYVSLKSMMEEIEQLFLNKVAEKGLDFIVELDPLLDQSAYIDELRLKQVLINLIGNAIKFTDEGYVEVFVTGSNLREIKDKNKRIQLVDISITVKDSGMGISREFQKEIFESFTQQSQQNTKKYGGTGLGLSISKKLIDLMHGSIAVSSEPSKGSSFNIHLPDIRLSYDQTASTHFTEIFLDHIKFFNSTVLIIDDIENNLNYLSCALMNTDLDTHTASNGEEALQLCNKIQPDLVITDLRMPIMDGYEFVKKFKSVKQFQNIPVIASSASVLPQTLKKIEKSDFDAILTKPIPLDKLYGKLSEFLPHMRIDPEEQKAEKEQQKNIQPERILELIKKLENLFLSELNRFKVHQPIDEVQAFGEKLKEIGHEHQAQSIIAYSNQILESIDNFDMDSMIRSLKSFDKLIEGLKKLESKNNRN